MTRAEYQEQRRRLEEVSLTSVPQACITRGCGVRLIVFRSFDGPLNWQLRKELPEALSLLFGIPVAKMSQ
jgi:hypothetical protein